MQDAWLQLYMIPVKIETGVDESRGDHWWVQISPRHPSFRRKIWQCMESSWGQGPPLRYWPRPPWILPGRAGHIEVPSSPYEKLMRLKRCPAGRPTRDTSPPLLCILSSRGHSCATDTFPPRAKMSILLSHLKEKTRAYPKRLPQDKFLLRLRRHT